MSLGNRTGYLLAVLRAALAFQRVDDIHGGYSLALGVFGIGDRITDNIFQKHFQHAARFFVDETRDTLHSSTAGQTTDGRLGDSLDVVTQHFTMTLGSSFTQTFASFSTTSHDEWITLNDVILTSVKL
uniref:Uncharacterized protein n=1 Tax=Anopheles minimus TaxID=112268 RepID=A0A182WM75_9DIPT